jgi:hypothetical protein
MVSVFGFTCLPGSSARAVVASTIAGKEKPENATQTTASFAPACGETNLGKHPLPHLFEVSRLDRHATGGGGASGGRRACHLPLLTQFLLTLFADSCSNRWLSSSDATPRSHQGSRPTPASRGTAGRTDGPRAARRLAGRTVRARARDDAQLGCATHRGQRKDLKIHAPFLESRTTCDVAYGHFSPLG